MSEITCRFAKNPQNTTRQWLSSNPQIALLALLAKTHWMELGYSRIRIFVQCSKTGDMLSKMVILKQPCFHSLQTTHWMELGYRCIRIFVQCSKRGDMLSNGYPLACLGAMWHTKCILRPGLVLCFTQIPWWRIGWRLGKMMKNNVVAFVKVSMDGGQNFLKVRSEINSFVIKNLSDFKYQKML